MNQDTNQALAHSLAWLHKTAYSAAASTDLVTTKHLLKQLMSETHEALEVVKKAQRDLRFSGPPEGVMDDTGGMASNSLKTDETGYRLTSHPESLFLK